METLDYLFVVPMKDESVIAWRSLRTLHDFLSGTWEGHTSLWCIVAVDNGSSPAASALTRQIAREFDDGRIVALALDAPGRGRAVQAAVRNHPARATLVLDADLPLDLNDIPAVLRPLTSGAAAVAVGKRTGARPFIRRLMTLGWRFAVRVAFGINLHDPQCGIVGFDTRGAELVLRECRETGWFLNTELLVRAKRARLIVQEVPICWIESRFPERASTVHLLRDTLRALGFVARAGLGPARRSNEVGRDDRDGDTEEQRLGHP